MPVRSENRPPDTRGGTAPLPLCTLITGAVALLLVLGGTFVVQAIYAARDDPVSAACREELTVQLPDGERLVTGARGVCNIVEGLLSGLQTEALVGGAVLGLIAIVVGFSTFRRMPSKRMREQAIAGAFLGVHAITAAVVLEWFRSGDLFLFVSRFLNAEVLKGSLDGFVRGAVNTLQLAFSGEIGGIIIGLILSVLVLSERRVVRAPARMYINFFRGTPLIWQLSFFFFLFTLGLDIKVPTFQVAVIVFCLNTGAYAAEVFRAGIQSIDKGQMEAARSLGMTYMQAMRYSIVPQAVRRVIPPLMNEFVILIKDTSLIVVLGLVAEDLDLYSFARQAFSDSRNSTYFVATAVGYLAVTLPLIGIVNLVERRVHSGLAGRGM
jgi:polar amino acid transport system permease protein